MLRLLALLFYLFLAVSSVERANECVGVKVVYTVPNGHFKDERVRVQRSLHTSLFYTTQVFEDVANGLYSDYQLQRCQNELWRASNDFNVSPPQNIREKTVIDMARSWLRTHEDAQVMLASVLVVVGIWWLVRALLALILNLVCPLMVVILAVVCVPQLRAPLLGQNYPVLANLLRNILLKMAENLKM